MERTHESRERSAGYWEELAEKQDSNEIKNIGSGQGFFLLFFLNERDLRAHVVYGEGIVETMRM